jgi:type I restriction enzyme S subunit
MQGVDQAIKGATLNKEKLKRIEFDFPGDRREQEKIAEILASVDMAVEQTELFLAKQQRIFAGLMHDLLAYGIDERGHIRSERTHAFKNSELGRIPKEWDVCLLDHLAQRGSGHTPNKGKSAYWNGGIKWVSLADSRKLDQIWINETDKEISELGLKNSSAVLHPKGTVILSRDAGVGKSAILADEMAVSQHFMAWRCKPSRLYNYYLYYWLQKDKPRFEGIASGSTIVTIGLQFFKEYKIAVPIDVAEQKRIAEALGCADKAIAQIDENLEKLRALKTGLMQGLLTGRRRVTSLLGQMTQRVGDYV